MLADWEFKVSCEARADASAALGIIARRGLGKLRHIDTNLLWVQEQAEKGKLMYGKVATSDNAADLLTKALTWEETLKHTADEPCVRGRG